MLEIARQRGIQFGYIGIDGGYGKEPAFLRGVDEQGCQFVADVHCVKRSICKTQNRWRPNDPGGVESQSIVSLNVLHSVLTSGRQRSHLRRGNA
jgi:hypothetical protein